MKTMRLVLVICMLVLTTVFLCGCGSDSGISVSKSASSKTSSSKKNGNSDSNEASVESICVYVCGEVKNPGVYDFHSGDRIVDAIEAAGGLTKKADETSVNQAELLEDAEQILIPSKSSSKDSGGSDDSGSDSSVSGSSDSSLISINHATKEELMTLPGIGESKADSIISYREEHGSFSKVEEIMNISGIKEGVYSKIKDYITL